MKIKSLIFLLFLSVSFSVCSCQSAGENDKADHRADSIPPQDYKNPKELGKEKEINNPKTLGIEEDSVYEDN